MATVRMCVRGKDKVGRWTLDFYDNGRRIVERTPWSSPKDKVKADKLLATRLLALDQGNFESASQQRDFEQLHTAFFAQLDVRAVTKGEYESTYRTHLQPYFRARKLRTITPQVVEQFRSDMQEASGRKKPAVRTVNRALTLLFSMLKYAEGHRWIASNPCRHVRRLRQPIDHRRKMLDGNILTPAECLRLYAAATLGRDRVLFRTAVETGMRQGELLGLQWGDVELDTGRIFVRSSCRKRKASLLKTAAAFRTITIKTELLPELRRWKLACPAAPNGSGLDLVFPNGAGVYEDAHNLLSRHFRPALRRAGLRAIRFHDLRHTCASLMLAHNVPIKVIQTHMGHASAQITLDTYGHLMPDAGSLGADVFAATFGAHKPVTEGAEGGVSSGLRPALTHVLGDVPTAANTAFGTVTSISR